MSNLPPPPPPPSGPPAAPPPPPGPGPSGSGTPPPPSADSQRIHGIATPISGPVVVDVQGVTKAFGNVVAVSDVTFQVGPGITALLGPNGAGKSTLFRMLCGLTAPSRGTVRVLGEDARTHREVRGRIGLAPQQDALFDRLTAYEFVEFSALTHGIANPDPAIREALAYVDLDADATKRVGEFSKGMRQRAKLAAAIVNDPDLLILDEPLTGLDPVQRQRMIVLFNELAERGKCLLVSSHVLDEVARLGSRVIVIAQGRLAAAGDYHALRDAMDDRPHRIRIATDQPRRFAAALIERGVADGIEVEDDGLVLSTLDVDTFGRGVAPMAVDLGLRLSEVAPLDDDLESVFRYLVERRR